jgi:hypothetical protein
VERKWRFEARRPDVTIIPPARPGDRWLAIVPLGRIPGRPDGTTLGSDEFGGLMDQLEEIWPPGGAGALTGLPPP